MKKFIAFAFTGVLTMAALVFLAAQPARANTPLWCTNLPHNLGVGTTMSDGEYSSLIGVLRAENLSDGLEGQMNFDENYAAAIVKIQAKYGIVQTGYLGPITRAKLNSIYGCTGTSGYTNSTPAPTNFVCPTGYICKPFNQVTTPTCPTGYICKSISDGNDTYTKPPSFDGYAGISGATQYGKTYPNFDIDVSTLASLSRKDAVRQMYLALQHREPDQQGWDYWVNSGLDYASMKSSMMAGVEYQTHIKIVNVFRSVLNRDPSDAELMNWYYTAEKNNYNVDVVRQGLQGDKQTGPSVLSASCVANVSATGKTITWNATVTGGSVPYKYSWSAYNDVTAYGEGSTQSAGFMASYGSSGNKSAVVIVTDTGGRSTTASCNGTIGSTGPVTQGLVAISNLAANLGTAIIQANKTVGYNVQFKFTLTAGATTAYLPIPAITSVVSAYSNSTGSLTDISADPAVIAGDAPVIGGGKGYYVIPAGASRTFTVTGTMMASVATGLASVQINAITYMPTLSTTASLPIPVGGWKVVAQFDGSSGTTPTPAPTATFTIEGAHNYTYNVGQTNHYVWSSTNADTFSSSYTSTGGTVCGGGPWVANTASGHSESYIASTYAGCTWTVTYTAKNSQTGQSASDTVTVKVNPLSSAAATTQASSAYDSWILLQNQIRNGSRQ